MKRPLLCLLLASILFLLPLVGCASEPKGPAAPLPPTTIELKSQIDSLTAKLNDLSGRLANLDSRIATLDGKVTGMGNPQALAGDISALRSSLTDLTTKLTDLTTKLTTVSSNLTALDTRLAVVEAKVATPSSASLDVNFTSISGGIRVTALSPIARTLAFRVTLYPTYYSIGDNQTTLENATKIFYGLNFVPNRSCEVTLKYNPTSNKPWEIYSVSFVTSTINLVANTPGTWDINFTTPIVPCIALTEVIYSAGVGATAGGI